MQFYNYVAIIFFQNKLAEMQSWNVFLFSLFKM